MRPGTTISANSTARSAPACCAPPARGPTNMSRWPCPAAVTSLSRPRSARWCRQADACWCRPPAPMPAACRRGRPRGRAAVRGRARPHRSAGRGPGPGTGPDDQPRGPGLQRNQQRHLPRCARHRPRRAGAGTARHHRRGLGLRRAAAGSVGPAGRGRGGPDRQQMPGGPARRRLRGGAARQPGRRAGPRRQLVAGPGRHLSAKPAAQRRAALHPARAHAGRLRRRAGALS